ncbi:MAG: hypothetical protein ACTJGD_09370 [Mesonia hippocampi]|uniref:hypothetical protein n=1 Tax=Mesonia hippocampi TaxID=1628250 RepID=UPI003F944586
MKTLFFLLIFFTCINTQAQVSDDQIKSLRAAFYTEALSLTPIEAEKFWPLHNKYEKLHDSLYENQWCYVKNGLETLSELSPTETDEILTAYVAYKDEKAHLKKQFITELKDILSAKKILQLKKAQRDFHIMLFEEYKNKK